MEPGATPQGIIALAFAGALVAGVYDAAYDMLSSSLQAMTSAIQLQAEFASMVEYFDGPPAHVVVSFTVDEAGSLLATLNYDPSSSIRRKE